MSNSECSYKYSDIENSETSETSEIFKNDSRRGCNLATGLRKRCRELSETSNDSRYTDDGCTDYKYSDADSRYAVVAEIEDSKKKNRKEKYEKKNDKQSCGSFEEKNKELRRETDGCTVRQEYGMIWILGFLMIIWQKDQTLLNIIEILRLMQTAALKLKERLLSMKNHLFLMQQGV